MEGLRPIELHSPRLLNLVDELGLSARFFEYDSVPFFSGITPLLQFDLIGLNEYFRPYIFQFLE